MPLDKNGNKSGSIALSQIQYFEDDFLWKVSPKILNSRIILKTVAQHEQMTHQYKL